MLRIISFDKFHWKDGACYASEVHSTWYCCLHLWNTAETGKYALSYTLDAIDAIDLVLMQGRHGRQGWQNRGLV